MLFRSQQRPAQATPKPAVARPKPKPVSPKSIAELRARGYRLKGNISPYNTASRLAGGRWNSPDTYYTIRNKVIPGDKINPLRIERDMGVWMR